MQGQSEICEILCEVSALRVHIGRTSIFIRASNQISRRGQNKIWWKNSALE